MATFFNRFWMKRPFWVSKLHVYYMLSYELLKTKTKSSAFLGEENGLFLEDFEGLIIWSGISCL